MTEGLAVDSPAGRAPAPVRSPNGANKDVLEARLTDLRAAFGNLRGAELVDAMIHQAFPGRIALVSSFGAEAAVLLHLVAQVEPSTPVLFLNTGKLFGETLRYRDRLQEVFGLGDVRAIFPDPRDLEAADPKGMLWGTDADACCHVRKVLPLKRALTGFDAEITGRKRFQTAARANMQAIELQDGRFKINPLADWLLEDLMVYAEKHKLPKHPLVKDGYLSIGCMPCTDRVKPGEDYRSGRWVGRDKDECGIHGPNVDGDGI